VRETREERKKEEENKNTGKYILSIYEQKNRSDKEERERETEERHNMVYRCLDHV